MIDQDGFRVLKRKEEPKKETTTHDSFKFVVNHKKRTVKTKPRCKYKKGTWKYAAWKRALHHKTGGHVKQFQNSRLANFDVYHEDGEAVSVHIHYGHYDKKRTKHIIKCDENASVLVNIGGGQYSRIPMKSYWRLLKIEKVVLSYKLTGWYDGEYDRMDIFEKEEVFDTVNDLLSFVNYQRQMIYGIYEVQAACCGYTDFIFDFKILVYNRDGTTKAYHSDMNDFMKDYGLMLF